MAAKFIHLSNNDNEVISIKMGFSWETVFFGCFPHIRRNCKYAIRSTIIPTILNPLNVINAIYDLTPLAVLNLFMCCLLTWYVAKDINKFYFVDALKKGYLTPYVKVEA